MAAPPLENVFTGTDGVTITNGNSATPNVLNSVTIGAGCTVTYSATQAKSGSTAMAITTPATPAESQVRWNGYGSITTGLYWRWYMYVPAYPAADTTIFVSRDSSFAVGTRLVLKTTGVLEARNAAGTAIAGMTGSTSVPTNAWFRVELYELPSTTAGEVTWWLYNTPESSTETETKAATGQVLKAHADMSDLGLIGSGGWASSTWYFDDLGVAAAKLGPTGAPPADNATKGGPLAPGLSWFSLDLWDYQGAGTNALAAVVAGVSTVTGTATVSRPLAGTVASDSTASGALTARVAGAVASASAVTGTLTARVAGAAASASTVTGTLTSRAGLAGTAAAVSTVAGSLTATGINALAGAVTARSAAAGTLVSPTSPQLRIVRFDSNWDPLLVIGQQANFEANLDAMVSFEPGAFSTAGGLQHWDVPLFIYQNVHGADTVNPGGPTRVPLEDSDSAQLYVPWPWPTGSPVFYARETQDIRSQTYRDNWLTFALDLFADGADGLWIDDANLDWEKSAVRNGGGDPLDDLDSGSWYTSPATGQVGWAAALGDFLHYVRDGIRAQYPNGKIILNLGGAWFALRPNRWTDARYLRMIDAADYINLEFSFLDGGLDNGPGLDAGTDFALRSMLNLVDTIHERHRNVIYEIQGAPTAAQKRYAAALYLLKRRGTDMLGAYPEHATWPTLDTSFTRDIGTRLTYTDPGTAGSTISGGFVEGEAYATPVNMSSGVIVGYVLAGTAASASTVTGSLTVRASVAAAVTSASSVTGTLSIAFPLAAVAASASSVAGALTVRAAVAGTTAGASAVTGTVTVLRPLAAAVTSASAVTGTVSIGSPLAAAVASASTVTGTVSVASPLAAAVAGVSTVTATLTNTAPGSSPLVGTVTAASSLTGALTSTVLLSATVAGASAVTGTLTNAAPGSNPLAGTVAPASTVTGSLTVRASVAAAVAAASTVAGTLTNTAPLAAAVAGVSAVTGTVLVTRPLAGAVASDSAVAGTLTNIAAGQNALAGTVASTSTVTGAVLVTKPLAAVVAGVSAVTGTLASRVALIAVAGASASNVTGGLTVRHPLAGAIAGSSDVAGGVLVAKRLTGTVVGVSGMTAALTNTGPITAVARLEGGMFVVFGEGDNRPAVFNESTSGALALTE